MAHEPGARMRKGRSGEVGSLKLGAAIENARRYYHIKTLSLIALVDLYGRLKRLMPENYKVREFRTAARIQREIYRTNLRRARQQKRIVTRFREVVLADQ